MPDPVPPLTVLYDGGCAFCRWVVAHLRRWDRDRNLRIRPYQETRDQPLLADLLHGRSLGRALHVVDGAGRVASGGDSVLAIAAVLPGGNGIARIVAALPFSRMTLALGYRAVEMARPILSGLGFNGPLIRERNPSFDRPTD